MTRYKYIDPELVPVVGDLRKIEYTLRNLEQIRQNSIEMVDEMFGQIPPVGGVLTEERRIQGPDEDRELPVRVYRPAERAGDLPGLFWIHGGGYIAGRAEADDRRCQQWVKSMNCVAVSVDYRLAPEHPFPAPVEDCYTALKWMFDKRGDLGVDGSRIVIGGISAGGGLAAGLALLARDRAEVRVSFQLLLCPMIDNRNVEPASDHLPDAVLWTRQNNRFGWDCYLDGNPGSGEVSPYAAAARANDLSDLPPAYIHVGDADLFAEENIDYARRLTKAGVPVELHVFPGGFHGFEVFAAETRMARQCLDATDKALKRALDGPINIR